MYEVIYQVSFNLSDIKYLALVLLLKHEEECADKKKKIQTCFSGLISPCGC